MIEKYASEQYTHSVPFQLAKGDAISQVTVVVYLDYDPEPVVSLAFSASEHRSVGYTAQPISGGISRHDYELGDDMEMVFEIRRKQPTAITDRQIVGQPTAVPQDATTWDVRIPLLKRDDSLTPPRGGLPGQRYLLDVKVLTVNKDSLETVEQLRIKRDLSIAGG